MWLLMFTLLMPVPLRMKIMNRACRDIKPPVGFFSLATRCDRWRKGRVYHSLWKMCSPPIADSDGFMYTFYCDLEKVMMIT